MLRDADIERIYNILVAYHSQYLLMAATSTILLRVISRELT